MPSPKPLLQTSLSFLSLSNSCVVFIIFFSLFHLIFFSSSTNKSNYFTHNYARYITWVGLASTVPWLCYDDFFFGCFISHHLNLYSRTKFGKSEIAGAPRGSTLLKGIVERTKIPVKLKSICFINICHHSCQYNNYYCNDCLISRLLPLDNIVQPEFNE